MSYAFYDYATTNKGIFTAMFFYKKYESAENEKATERLFYIMFKVLKPLDISDDNINHIIRTFRSFLEGFCSLVNSSAFGNPVSIKESFDVSVEIIINGIKSLAGGK